MEDGVDGATHVAVEIDRAWCDDVAAALTAVVAGEVARLDVVLARWWQRREARLDVATVELDAEVRGELVAALAGDDLFADLAASSPPTVRTDALARLRRVAPRLAALTGIGAPAIILDRQRVVCAQLLAELDPRAAREPVIVPEVGTTVDAGGEEVVDLHGWLGHMLLAAQVDAPSVGLGDAFAARPEAVAFLAGTGGGGDGGGADDAAVTRPPPVRIWPGPVTFAVRPDLAFWASPAIALPHRVEVPGEPPSLVVAESSGPITYAVADDAPGDALVPELAARVRGLGRDRALLSFVWLTTDPAGPWRPLGGQPG
jgi:hypothetical protein